MTESPPYGRPSEEIAGSTRSPARRMLAAVLVGVLLGSTLLWANYALVPRPTTCSTCVLGSIGAGYGPSYMVFDNASGRLYVLDSGPGGFTAWGVTVINGYTNTVVGFFHTGQRPGDLTYDSRNGDLYITGFCTDTIFVLNATTGANVTWIDTASTPLCEGPESIAYDPANGFIDVLQVIAPQLLLIDGATNRVLQYVNVGATPFPPSPIGTNPNTGQIYVSTDEQYPISFNLTTLNGSTGAVELSVALNGSPQTFTFDPINQRVYVGVTIQGFGEGNLYNGTLITLDSTASHTLASTRIGDLPSAIAVDGANGNLYITNSYSSNVSVVDGTTNEVTGSIPVNADPWSIVYDGGTRCLYALFYEGYVSVIAPPGSECPAPPSSSLPLWESITGVIVLVAIVSVVGIGIGYSRRRA